MGEFGGDLLVKPANGNLRNDIARGELLVIPTDTVYGIASDPFSRGAVERLLAAKGRDETKPPPLLGATPEELLRLADFDSPEMEAKVTRIANAFWPGSLTLIVPTRKSFGWDTDSVGKTIAVRVPDHELAREILQITGPLAVTSANKTGEAPATSVDQARNYFADEVRFYFDGGPTKSDVPSSILNCSGHHFELIREGAIGLDQLAAFL